MIANRLTRAPKDDAERLSEIARICQRKDWCQKLAERWHVCASTVRNWMESGILGPVVRRNAYEVRLSSMTVYEFEKRYSAALGVGERVWTMQEIARGFGVSRRTVDNWRRTRGFPAADRVPRSNVRRWRNSQVVEWARRVGIQFQCP